MTIHIMLLTSSMATWVYGQPMMKLILLTLNWFIKNEKCGDNLVKRQSIRDCLLFSLNAFIIPVMSSPGLSQIKADQDSPIILLLLLKSLPIHDHR